MTCVIIIILSTISISLKLSASSIDLASKLFENSEVVSKGLTTSSKILKLIAFIIARVRDMIASVGIISLIIGLIIFLVTVVSVSSFSSLFTTVNEVGVLEMAKVLSGR